jgi:hypothetical protein
MERKRAKIFSRTCDRVGWNHCIGHPCAGHGAAELLCGLARRNFANGSRELSADKDLSSRLIKRLDLLMSPPEADLIQKQQRHVDFSVFGSVPLEIYIETKEQRYLD